MCGESTSSIKYSKTRLHVNKYWFMVLSLNERDKFVSKFSIFTSDWRTDSLMLDWINHSLCSVILIFAFIQRIFFFFQEWKVNIWVLQRKYKLISLKAIHLIWVIHLTEESEVEKQLSKGQLWQSKEVRIYPSQPVKSCHY